MIPASFSYIRAASLDAALGELSDGTKIIAGGQSLLPLLKLRMASVDRLVDIGRLSELKGVRDLTDGGVEIGALATYAEVMATTRLDFAREAIEQIGDLQVRNVGTVGGSIAHADPASDAPALALALDYSAVLRSRRGERLVPLDGFFLGPFQSAIEPDEILTEVRLPAMPAGAGYAFEEFARRHGDFALVGIAALSATSRGSPSRWVPIRFVTFP